MNSLNSAFYQRAEPPLVNGSWSQLAGCCVNSDVLKFCKSGLIEVSREQVDMSAYDIKLVDFKLLVIFDTESIVRLLSAN